MAAWFTGKQAAGATYSQMQNLIFSAPDCELSVYRFHIKGVWYVAVIGVSPDEGLSQELAIALAHGTPILLGTETLNFLQHRRETQSKQGTWVERHHHPGLGFRFRR
jgi:hypothetical protein